MSMDDFINQFWISRDDFINWFSYYLIAKYFINWGGGVLTGGGGYPFKRRRACPCDTRFTLCQLKRASKVLRRGRRARRPSIEDQGVLLFVLAQLAQSQAGVAGACPHGLLKVRNTPAKHYDKGNKKTKTSQGDRVISNNNKPTANKP